jgi:CheY-like chemotaxis protein
VILSDINMPGIDGLTLLREIKERWPDLPVIMVTAYGDDERRRRASEYGAAEFITKPVNFKSCGAIAAIVGVDTLRERDDGTRQDPRRQ